MLSGGHQSNTLTFPAFCPQRTNLRTVSPTEARDAPRTSGDQRKMVNTVICSLLPKCPGLKPLPTSKSNIAGNGSAQMSHGRRTILTQQQAFSHKGDDYRSHLEDVGKLLKGNPILLRILTNNTTSLCQSKGTPLPTAGASVRKMSVGSRKKLSDDEILQLIEEQLTMFRAQMKFLKERESSVKGTVPTSCSSQGPTLVASAPSTLVDHVSKDGREKETLGAKRQGPDPSIMRNAAPSKQHAEHVENIPDAAAPKLKMAEKRPVVLQALESSSTSELVKRRPTDTVSLKWSIQKPTAVGRDECVSLDDGDPSTQRKITTPVDLLSGGTDSSKSRPQISSALKPTGMRMFSALTNWGSKHLSQCSSSSTDKALTSGKSEMERELEKEVQVQLAKMNEGSFGCLPEGLKLPKYDDISDGEEVLQTSQSSTHNSMQNKDVLQAVDKVYPIGHMANSESAENEDINSSTSQFHKNTLEGVLDNEEKMAGSEIEQVQISGTLKTESTVDGYCCPNIAVKPVVRRPPKRRLACHCVSVETEEGFVEDRCAECLRDICLQTQECESEDGENLCLSSDSLQNEETDEEDDWFVFHVMALDVKHESTEDVDASQDESPKTYSFQKLAEFDSLESFRLSRTKRLNSTSPLGTTNIEPSGSFPASKNLPNPSAFEIPVWETASTPVTKAEDSGGADNNNAFPTKQGCLTVPFQARKPSPHSFSSADKKEGEISPKLSPIPTESPPHSALFSDLMTGEDKEYTNSAVKNSVVPSSVKQRLRKETSCFGDGKRQQINKEKAFKKVRLSLDVDGHSDELNRAGKSVLKLKSRSSQLKSDQSGQLSHSNSRKRSRHEHQNQVVKRRETSSTPTSGPKKQQTTSNPGGVVQKMPVQPPPDEKASGLQVSLKSRGCNCSISTQNAATKAALVKQSCVERLHSQPSTNHRALSLTSTKTPQPEGLEALSLNGEQYWAAALPGNKHCPPMKSTVSNSNSVNSYDTKMSTAAKRTIVQDWEDSHIQIRKKARRSSYERETSTCKSMPEKKSKSPLKRQRRNSHDLMKRTISEAKRLTKQTHRQPSAEPKPGCRFNARGYKWKTTNDDFNWDRERCTPEPIRGITEH